MHISITQALCIYDELIKALYGYNSYGGQEAEIYTYRLLPYDAIYMKNWSTANPRDYFWKEIIELEQDAARALIEIIVELIKSNECTVTIETENGFIDYKEWGNSVLTMKTRFSHRIHVRVTKNKLEVKL